MRGNALDVRSGEERPKHNCESREAVGSSCNQHGDFVAVVESGYGQRTICSSVDDLVAPLYAWCCMWTTSQRGTLSVDKFAEAIMTMA